MKMRILCCLCVTQKLYVAKGRHTAADTPRSRTAQKRCDPCSLTHAAAHCHFPLRASCDCPSEFRQLPPQPHSFPQRPPGCHQVSLARQLLEVPCQDASCPLPSAAEAQAGCWAAGATWPAGAWSAGCWAAWLVAAETLSTGLSRRRALPRQRFRAVGVLLLN